MRQLWACALILIACVAQADEFDAPFLSGWAVGMKAINATPYVPTLADKGYVLKVTVGSATINLPSAGAMPNGYVIGVYAFNSSSVIIHTNGGDLLYYQGGSSASTYPNGVPNCSAVIVMTDAVNWYTVGTYALPEGTVQGDLSGSLPTPTVARINSALLGTTTATSGNVLIGSGTAWVTQALTGDATITSGGVVSLANTTTARTNIGLGTGATPTFTGLTTSGGNIAADSVGKGFQTKEGSNAKQGVTGSLSGGTLVVANTAITANSRLLLTRQAGGTNPGAVYESARNAGTSFTVTSTNAADTGTVAYEIFEPAP